MDEVSLDVCEMILHLSLFNVLSLPTAMYCKLSQTLSNFFLSLLLNYFSLSPSSITSFNGLWSVCEFNHCSPPVE